MTEFSNAPLDITQVQVAQNVLSDLYANFSKSLKLFADDLNFSFYSWFSHNFTNVVINETPPIWDESYAAFSFLPLLNFSYHLINFDNSQTVGAKKGDAFITVTILTNKAYEYVDFGLPLEKRPITLPTGEAEGRVYVYHALDSALKSLEAFWLNFEYPEDIDANSGLFDTDYPGIKCWAKTFDLAAFLLDTKPLIAEIKSYLAKGDCPIFSV